MEVNTHINKCIVYIIESLPDGDLRTGRNLYENLKQEWLYNDDYDSIYKVVNSKGELKQILFEIAEIAKAQDNHTFCILQFEAHGS
jgi:type II secretory pathway component PulF